MKRICLLFFICLSFALKGFSQKDDITYDLNQDYIPETGRPATINYQLRVFKQGDQVNFRVFIKDIRPYGNYFIYQNHRYTDAELGGDYIDKLNYSNVKGGKLDYHFVVMNQYNTQDTKTGVYSFASMSLGSYSGDGKMIWAKDDIGSDKYKKLDVSWISYQTKIVGLNIDNSPVVNRIRSLQADAQKAKTLYDKAYNQYINGHHKEALSSIRLAENNCDGCDIKNDISGLKSSIEDNIERLEKEEKEKKQNDGKENDGKEEKKDDGGKEKSSSDKNKKEKESENNSTSDSDSKLYQACITLSNAVMQKVEYARNHRSDAQAWQNAQDAIDNYRCKYIGISQDVRDEVNRNLTATVISGAVVGTIAYLSSSPWTYGYGQFLDAKNKTYIHRFIIGTSPSYEQTFAKISFSLMCNLMRLPSRQLSFRFEAENSSLRWDATKTKSIDNISSFMISGGPNLTFWPLKNFFVSATPELMLGAAYGNDVPVSMFQFAPALNTQAGFRIGKVYLSGHYGLFSLKMKPDSGMYGGAEAGTLQSNQYGTIKGEWLADKFDDGKAVVHKYWVIGLGLDL